MPAGSRFPAFGAERPSLRVGVMVTVVAVVIATAAVYPLKAVAPIVSLSVVYLPGVLLVSAYWGLWLGLFTSLVSATAFNFFHIPPLGRFTIANGRNWVALAAFMVAAAVVSTMAEIARGRTSEAERRRGEADLAAVLARELLAGQRTSAALGVTARRVAEALAIPSARIELAPAPGSEREAAIPLYGSEGEPIATLVVDRDLSPETMERVRTRVAPALGALVAIALDRDAIQAGAVETAALRRSDELKTALLRAVSHDLRTPLTAIVTAGHALGSGTLTSEERTQLSAAVVEEGERLSSLIEKLFDLSRLQAGRAEPQRDWISMEEVVLAARDALPTGAQVRLRTDPDVPAVMADAAQLERVFANLLENALRYSNGQPVSADVRRSGHCVVVYVVDRGPGINPGEQERIFEAFYQGPQSGRRTTTGSGLGLAIAKGFVEANGGTIALESVPGHGTSFTVSFPLSGDAQVAM